jgi:hypothetical protein
MTAKPLALALIAVPFLVLPPAAARRTAASPSDRPDHARCATWEIRSRLVAEGIAIPDGRGALPCDHTPVGPPPNPQVGDSWNWYLWQLNGFPVAVLSSCTVRGMGDHCYVVVQDTQWNVTMDQAKVDAIVDAFENQSIGPYPAQGIWDLDTSHFGMPPDNLDQDPRVYILYYDFDVNSDGFFWGFDQECDDVAAFHSNECDVVYMNCSDFDPAGEYLLAVLAHEFEHLIHSHYDASEEAWVDEGLAELAMWLYGNPDTISQFNAQPDRNLTVFNGNWYDYIKSYLFTLYFFERYGGLASVKDLVADPLNGIAGYEQTLDDFAYAENFEDVFSDWVVANFLDDTSIGDGRFGYAGETLPAFNPFVTISVYPAGPSSQAVQHWGADYARYINGTALHMTFDGSDNNKYAVRAMLLDDSNATQVVDMSLNASQAGTLPLPQLGATHDEAVVVYASIQTPGTNAYTYGAGVGLVDVPAGAGRGEGPVVRVLGSVSARPVFALSIPPGAGVAGHLEIHDVGGRLVRRLWESTDAAGGHEVAWDGRNAEGSAAAPGTYFVRLTAGAQSVTSRVTLRR